jgi:hypothetical protein
MKLMKTSFMLMLILSLILIGCSKETGPFHSSNFLDELTDTNLDFAIIDNDEKDPFFSVVPKVVGVNGEYILIYEYSTTKKWKKKNLIYMKMEI